MARTVVFLLALATLGCGAVEKQKQPSMNYYIAPNGHDQNSGAINSPWRTLEHALQELSPGDVLSLRQGTYYEHEITVDIAGTASAPITIQSYPGERAVIDGGVPFFQTVSNDEWELVDGDIHLYRSLRTFPDESGFVRAWLVDDDVQLVEYESAENLKSENYGPLNGLEPIYIGPGLQLHSDGHIYIRLAYNPNDLTNAAGDPIAPTPSDVNPNHNRVAVYFSKHLFILNGASHLHFKNLEFAHARYILDVRNGSHHVTLRGCRFNYGNQGIVLREEVRSWEISSCDFNNGVPAYIYWTDVKNKNVDVVEAYPEFQSAAINGTMTGSNIHHNVFRNTFDGLRIEHGSSDTYITHNVFWHVHDDSINLSRGISDVEVSHNLLWHVMGGIANLGSNEAPGHVYIHHNVIDNSAYQRGGRPGNYREDNWPAWTIGSPFPSHDDGSNDSWWKLYNNTIVTRQDVGHRWSPAGPDDVAGNPEKYVLNNIFYTLDERVIFRNDLVSSGSYYDGNVFYRSSSERLPLFTDFGDGGRYDSLRAFRDDSGTDWERHGLEMDPGFKLSDLHDPTREWAEIWEQYRPTTVQMFTVGASYDGLDWPGTQGVNYRGAVPPSVDLAVFLPLVRYGLRDSAEAALTQDAQR